MGAKDIALSLRQPSVGTQEGMGHPPAFTTPLPSPLLASWVRGEPVEM